MDVSDVASADAVSPPLGHSAEVAPVALLARQDEEGAALRWRSLLRPQSRSQGGPTRAAGPAEHRSVAYPSLTEAGRSRVKIVQLKTERRRRRGKGARAGSYRPSITSLQNAITPADAS